MALMSAQAGASGSQPQGTEMINSYGEGMELDFTLYDKGSGDIVDYSQFGSFENVGTDKYQYKVTDKKGLAAAVGEGIYPNNSVYKDPVLRILSSKGKIAGSQWDYVNIDDQQLAFYRWATASTETPGVQQYYTALALEKLGQHVSAINAYYAVIVHTPKAVGWSWFRSPLYMARLAIDRIDFITRKHPELGIKLVGAKISVENGYNWTTSDDRFIVDPGKLVKVDPSELKLKRVDLSGMKTVRTLGGAAAQFVQYENGHWQMMVDGKPFVIKGIAYTPTPVGRSPHDGYDLNDWMISDLNQNGKIDGPFDSWVDANGNNEQDPNEPVVGDFALLKAMGVNTIRFYHHAKSKELLRQLYKDYGIRVIMGDFLGMYAVGSGADWFAGTDYTDEPQKEKMRQSVREMVMEYKDEPYVLMWMLGNESNYGEPGVADVGEKKGKVGLGSRAKLQPEAHYGFVNEVAGLIKSIDPSRPVGVSNGEVITIDILGRNSNNIDVFAANVYRGSDGFGRTFWEDARDHMDKPVLVAEFGCPAYHSRKNQEEADRLQMEYLRGNWEDIRANIAGYGYGNAIGGVLFEFIDEWWKAGPRKPQELLTHSTKGDFKANFPDEWIYEEWLGVADQGDGSHSPYLRHLRRSYDYFKKAWN